MQRRMRLDQIDCTPTKEGGVVVSIRLSPPERTPDDPRKRRPYRSRKYAQNRPKELSKEQLLELAREAIEQALADPGGAEATNGPSAAKTSAPPAQLGRWPLQDPWPG